MEGMTCGSRTTLTVVASLIILLIPADDAASQRCAGHTSYLVRDTLGQVMTREQIQQLRLSVDGVPQFLRPARGRGLPFFEYSLPEISSRPWDSTNTDMLAAAANPLSFDSPLTSCGRIADITLGYGTKVMRMLFDIGDHNTHLEIDSPPFHDGTFHLGRAACSDRGPAPRIDNRTTGVCFIAADSWEGMDKPWVRHVIPAILLGVRNAFLPLSVDECRRRGIVAITSPSELRAVWNEHPEIHGDYSEPPKVDFRWKFVLAVYQPGHHATYSYTSFPVDKNQDLTFVPVLDSDADPSACDLMFLTFYRSGISSVAGRPLPPAPG